MVTRKCSGMAFASAVGLNLSLVAIAGTQHPRPLPVQDPQQGAVAAKAKAASAPKVLRVGGDYQVAAIDQAPNGTFTVEFKALKQTGRFDLLRLTSDHVHVAVRLGQTLRLSAEVIATTGPAAEVTQLVIFFPSPQGRVPVWLLSSRLPAGDLTATRYLEMHAPLTDYRIL